MVNEPQPYENDSYSPEFHVVNHEGVRTPILELDDDIRLMLRKALNEDVGAGDVTTMATIPEGTVGNAKVVVKETGILCGVSLFGEVYRMVDPSVNIQTCVQEGETLYPGKIVFLMQGPLGSILAGERVALNMLGLMSGVATNTSEHVKAVRHTNVKITDTRKTIPLYRKLQKYAVRIGGGVNHRIGLYDMVLIKDNHIDSCGGIRQAVAAARKKWGKTYAVEVETRNLQEVHEALDSGVDRIMLDNMDIDTMVEAVKLINGRCETEASGGVNLHTVSFVAETGVDFISIGALTHSMRCLDFSMTLTQMAQNP